MPARFVGVNSTFDEQRLAINDLATDLFALQNKTSVDYARVAGVATYANYAGFSTYTPLAGVSTYSSISGYSTTSGYADIAGIATNATFSVQAGYAVTAGVSTEAGYATAAGFADTSTYGTYAYYSQIAGFATAAQDSQTANLAESIKVTAQNTGTNYLTFVNVLGDGSYQNVWTDSELKYEPATNSFYAGIISATSISGDGSGLFNVPSEIVGVSTAGTSGFNNLNITGVSTFSSSVGIGTSAGGNALLHFPMGDTISTADIIRAGSGLDYTLYAYKDADQHYMRQMTLGNYSVSVGSSEAFRVSNSSGFSFLAIDPGGMGDDEVAFVVNPDTSTELRYNYNKKLETTDAGVSVTGELNVSGDVNIGTAATTVNLPTLRLKGNSQETNFIANPSISIGGTVSGKWYDTFLVDGPTLQYVRHWANGFDVNFSVPDEKQFVVSNTDGANSLLSPGVSDNQIAFKIIPESSTELRYNKVKKLETAGYGVTVTGTVYADDFSTAGIATANEFRLNTYGSTSYTRMGGGQVLASGVNDKGSIQVGALTTVFSMGHAPFNHSCYFSQTGENDWVWFSSLSTISMRVNGGISTRPHSVTVRELYVDTNANVAGVSTFAGDVGIGTDQSSGLILTSPNGTKYRLVVDNVGNLSTVAV